MSRRPPSPTWIDEERDALRAQITAEVAPLIVDGVTVSWPAANSRRELQVTIERAGAMAPSVVAELQGLTAPAGWRLRAVFPSRTGVTRQSANAGSTSAAAATVLRWATWWHASYAPSATQQIRPEDLHAAATADLVAGAQAIAARLRAILMHRLNLRSPSHLDLLLGLETMAAPHLDAQEADDLVQAVRKLWTQTTPLEGADLESLADICEIDVGWLATGTGPNPLP